MSDETQLELFNAHKDALICERDDLRERLEKAEAERNLAVSDLRMARPGSWYEAELSRLREVIVAACRRIGGCIRCGTPPSYPCHPSCQLYDLAPKEPWNYPPGTAGRAEKRT